MPRRALVAAGLTPLFARIYAARGVNEAADLEHELARLPEWSALKGIRAAAARLADGDRAR